MATGKVKWFNNAKGYGFIRPDTGGEDLFVHYSYICMEGYRSLKAGQQVTYDVREAPKGLHAVNIGIVGLEQNQTSQEETESVNAVLNSKPVELQDTLHAAAV